MATYCFQNVPQNIGNHYSCAFAKSHYDYVERYGKYSTGQRGEDIVYRRSGNLPEWADGKASKFWEAADISSNHSERFLRSYREFRFALQEELSPLDNEACVDEFLKRSGIEDNHVYSLAIHNKKALDGEHWNIHCHVMFNEKIIEKDRPLGPDKYFSRYSKNRAGEVVGGYRTSRYYSKKTTNKELRQLWADIVNAKFAERGIDAQISCESLAVQKQKLQDEGRLEEAATFDRKAAPHMGPKIRSKQKEIISTAQFLETAYAGNPNSPLLKNIDKDTKDLLLSRKVGFDDFAEEKFTDILVNAYAKDMVLRAEGKKLQKSRKDNLDKEMPFAITAGDLVDALQIRIENKKKELEALTPDLGNKHYISAKALDSFAKSVLSRGKYSKLKKELVSLSKVAAPTGEQLIKIDKLKTDLSKLEGQFQTEAATKQLDLIRQQQMAVNEEIRLLYAKDKDKRAKKQYEIEQLEKKLEDLSKEDSKKIIFAEKIPPNVNLLTSKIAGVKPIKELKQIKIGNDTYCIFSSTENTKDNTTNLKAVRLGDDVIKGKAQVYDITVKGDEKILQKAPAVVIMYHRINVKELSKPVTKTKTRFPNFAKLALQTVVKALDNALVSKDMPKIISHTKEKVKTLQRECRHL